MWSPSGCGDVVGRLEGVLHPWFGMLLSVKLALLLWHGPLGPGAGAAEVDADDVSYGDWPCSIRCTFGGVSRSNRGLLP